MDGWRLTPNGEEALARFEEKASPEQRRRMGEVFETIINGTWRNGRWWTGTVPEVENMTEVRAGDGVILHARKYIDPDNPDLVWIDVAGAWVVEDDEADLGHPRD